MLDESLPTYRFHPSSDDPLLTLLYFTHNGSESAPEFLLKRPALAESANTYALGLLDVHYNSVIYAEVLIKPEWSQPSLSAAEIRAQGGNVPTVPLIPETFGVLLYNPDQSITVRHHQSSWSKTDSWEFEIPERTFKVPSSSQIDQDSQKPGVVDLEPKVMFRWKRDSRISKDMTCYMSGRSVGGKKSKEPDITVALFRGGKTGGMVTIYEPNMRRVEVEDRKGLEQVFLLSAEVIRDLYLVPKQDPFNTAGASSIVSDRRKNSRTPSAQTNIPMASGALGIVSPVQAAPSSSPDPQRAQIDAETKRLQDMVAQENRAVREREKRDQEEQARIKRMLEQEEQQRQRREAEVERETERLRKQYGVQAPPSQPSGHSPNLPPRNQAGPWLGQPGPAPPQRPNSVGPPEQQKKKFGLLAPAGASVSGFFHRGDEDKKKLQQKRSVQF